MKKWYTEVAIYQIVHEIFSPALNIRIKRKK